MQIEGIAEKPPVQPGGGTEPEKAVLISGFGAKGRPPLSRQKKATLKRAALQ